VQKKKSRWISADHGQLRKTLKPASCDGGHGGKRKRRGRINRRELPGGRSPFPQNDSSRIAENENERTKVKIREKKAQKTR